MSLRSIARFVPVALASLGVFMLVLVISAPGGEARALVNCDVADMSLDTQENALIAN